MDHILPPGRWEEQNVPPYDYNDPINLAAACFPCNRAKWAATAGIDELTGEICRLFNPRQDHWDEHFMWSHDFLEMYGLTGIGRATCARLSPNRTTYQRQRERLRRAMLNGGPPWP